jgi:hypothetical protein
MKGLSVFQPFDFVDRPTRVKTSEDGWLVQINLKKN